MKRPAIRTRDGDELPDFDWGRLAPRVLHDVRIEIIEAMRYLGRPLSAADLRKVFEERYGLSLVAYHLQELAKAQAVVLVRSRRRRGSTEKFYEIRSELLKRQQPEAKR